MRGSRSRNDDPHQDFGTRRRGVGIGNDALRIGMKLEVVFEAADGDVRIPKFQPARG